MDDGNSTATRLLTLLNVSALKSNKRKNLFGDDSQLPKKLNKRKTVAIFEPSTAEAPEEAQPRTVEDEESGAQEEAVDNEEEEAGAVHPYEYHFGPETELLSKDTLDAAQNARWKSHKDKLGKLGSVVKCTPDSSSKSSTTPRANDAEKLGLNFRQRQKILPLELRTLQNDLLSAISTYEDFFWTRVPLNDSAAMRETVTLHALNHIYRKRRRVLKNNERLSQANKSPASIPTDVQDQGFTRPSVLILLPFRSAALRWMNSITAHTPSPDYQIENHARFLSEYGLPPGTEDKLESAAPGAYPQDHIEMFKGNVDDSFRVGVKMTRKSVKLFADFYQCDVILASPLGLRMSIQKEKNADFLSSIEMLIIDHADALLMQNWEHIQFVLSNLNGIPQETRDTDFSRIKPWYLDGLAKNLRQTVLLSAYETPELRSLFNNTLVNVAGKNRTESYYSPVQVPEGVDQSFIQFECTSHKDESDKRFEYFTTKLLPSLMKSAVQSTNAIIFVPSSFDFIRVHNYFRKLSGTTFTVLSEYSTNQDISRARQAFFSGSKAFLLVSERFHFFRRYKIRGARNIVFYAPPDHPQFYTEFLSFPLLDGTVEPTDITSRVLYSRYDAMRLARICGTEGGASLLH